MADIYIPRTEKSGTDFTVSSDFSGSDGGKNRTYTLSYSDSVAAGLQVNVDGTDLSHDKFSLSSGVLTITVNLFDDAVVTINYFTQTSTAAVVATTNLDVIRQSGIGVNVSSETVGTGTGSKNDFELDDGNVISGSYTLKYAASDSHSFTELTETTHYTLDLDSGLIHLTAAGLSALGTNILYADYVHSPEISDSEVSFHLTRAAEAIELMTGNKWDGVTTYTEYLDGRETPVYPTTNHPYVDSDPDEQEEIQLKYKNVQSITSIKFLSQTGGSDLTLSSDQYALTGETGTILLYTVKKPVGKRRIEVVYTQGYSTVPTYIKELYELQASISLFSSITGGSYDDATSFSLGRKSITVGEVYVNVRETVAQFTKRRDELLRRVGNNLFVC